MIRRAGVLAIAIAAIAAVTPPSLARVAPLKPSCPPGYSIVPTAGHPLCAHDAADPLPSRSRVSAAARAAPRCYGDGVSGDRVQLLYVYPRDGRVRPGISDRITRDIAPAIEGLVRARSRGQGQEVGLRFQMPGCKLRVDLVALSESALDPEPTVNEQLGRIIDELQSLGFDARDRKYLVWADTAAAPIRPNAQGTGPCGIATLATVDTGPAPNPFDNPTPVNYHNGVVPLYAVVFATQWALLGGTPCWGGRNGGTVEAHELFHTLGAVQVSAPNSNGLGHCTDEPDIMCYSEGGVFTRNVCTEARTELLDCGGDDYFNSNPPAGSYLATHWNTARSSFLGEALTDDVPVKFRSP